MKKNGKTIWITWEEQRRTEELARLLGVKLHKLIYKGPYYLKVLVNSLGTLKLILAERPSTLIVQNPSMSLAALACLLKPAGYRLVVDRHSNFKFHTAGSGSPKYKAFHVLSRYTVRKADLTIVTNQFLKDVVDSWGGRGFILQDAIPSMPLKGNKKLKGSFNIAYPCSFDSDEPVKEVLEAAASLPAGAVVHITGNPSKLSQALRAKAPANVVFTGFLSEAEYQTLINSSDLVYALTTQDHTLLCCAYEALSAGKPMVLSNKDGLREYFGKGRVLADNSPASIGNATRAAMKDYERLRAEARELAGQLRRDWQARFERLKSLIKES